MLYDDTNKVLEDIKSYFQNKFGEKFDLEIVAGGKTNIFSSSSFQIEVNPSFIQARIPSDFSVKIEDRLDGVIENFDFSDKSPILFGARIENGNIEYFCELDEIDYGQSPIVVG